jgi:hypothetical protein
VTALGIALWALAALWLLWLYATGAHARPYPRYGYLGLAVIAVAEVLLFQKRQFVGIFFTPIAWTGYIAAVDAAVYSLAGQSMLNGRGRQFLAVTAMSAPFWLVFEAYNLRLQNWAYIGLPTNTALRYFGYAWAFSTIWPAMLETAQFLQAAGLWQPSYAPVKMGAGLRRVAVALGAAMLAIPLLAPRRAAAYLFGLAWLGFIFLLDPINSRLGAASLSDELAGGRRARFYALLAAGAVCGIFWEFWNYWAISKWIYIFPILQNAKIFEMPVPGYLGFLPFALENFCVYVFLTAIAQRAIGIRGTNHYVADF